MSGKLNKRDQTGIGGFEWNERKRVRILEERGIDFIDAAKMLMGLVYEYESPRSEEPRFVAVGASASGPLIAVVYTIRGKNLRIITARAARKNEQRAYLYAVANPSDEGQD